MSEETDPLKLLKAQLASALDADATDFETILQLAAQISKLEPDVVRFTTDAAMVRRLGRELVAKQETALGELVKNAYDADATVCSVDLVERGEGTYAFEIVDDGSGMTQSELADGFMRLASDSKVRNPLSPRFHRSRAGKKGIGRFATERLGQRLTIVTQTVEEKDAWTVTIDWDAFAQGSDIGLIANRIVSGPKEREHGTRLTIEGLRDEWTDADLRRVYRYLATLLQPMFEEAESGRGPDDAGFSVRLTRSGNDLGNEDVATIDTEILDQALAIIEAHVDEAGNATWALDCTRFEITLKDVPIGLDRNMVSPLANARNVRLKAWYFIQSREFLGHSTGFVKRLLVEQGGIRLYRNGYRVRPYGEKHDDWLGLDFKNTRIYAPFNSKTFLGFVAVSDPTGERFEETSSREGLIQTAALEEVRQLAYTVLVSAVGRIEAKRGLGRKKPEAKDPQGGESAAKEAEAAAAGIEQLLQDIEHDDGSGIDPERREQLSIAVDRLSAAARASADFASERDALLEELSMMRILASMGLTIAEFTHDFSALAETMELNLNALAGAAGPRSDQFDVALGRFRNQFRQVRAYTAHFGSMTTSNASRDLQNVDLYGFCRQFVDDLSVMFDRRGLELTVERPSEYQLLTAAMHPSEWSSVLLNLLTNAIKAVNRSGRQGRFLIQLGRLDGNQIYLDFSDNGDGILPENRSQIFDAFFTTSGAAPVRASESVQALGTGLGLKIVADIASAAGGFVAVLDKAPEGFVTTIRVAVSAAPEPQVIV
ncbi:sensor histidine kinase [Mesorhizobium sp.]|uniref:sensor histidine kinase n=1 Tax=Mesorhizobium sp. TaxID=1871066 RepID=UPI000FE7BBA1|nr:sensor histidine kinase [Mesorhizobium sp.]RWP10635.1 MAG: sensor histidine kinase [Mesorhizobium sp.]